MLGRCTNVLLDNHEQEIFWVGPIAAAITPMTNTSMHTHQRSTRHLPVNDDSLLSLETL